MRLINADKLRHELIMGHDLIGAKYTDMADTVEAIPTEWIKSKVDAILKSYPNGNEETEIICKLLYEWEKENDRN